LLVELRLPAQFQADLERHLLHPALLDSATTAVRLASDGFHLPFCCRSLVVYEALPAHAFAVVRRQPSGAGTITADVDVLAPDGRLLVRASGYTLRKVDPDQAVAATAARTGAAFVDGGTDGGGIGGGAGGDVNGVDPAHGARIALGLLGADHPGQVLVEPGGRPFVAREAVAVGAAVAAPPASFAPVGAPEPPVAGVAPADRRESVRDRMSALWVEVIGDAAPAPDANFFEVGGDSLSAVTLIGRVREVFGVDVSISAIFDYPSIAALSALLHEQGAR
jgi:acyl carrier protein